MDLQEVEWEGMKWIDLAQYRQIIVNVAVNLRVPKNAGSFSGRILLCGASKLVSRSQNLRLQTAV